VSPSAIASAAAEKVVRMDWLRPQSY
jgi:hypothetical protein